ncbi:Hypothetical predicted protein [Paramuricea clavata]|nr:Hypothetical predicted protein [Paramuricea clavata]
MDGVSPFLDYYNEVFDFLHQIYRTTLTSVDMSRNNLMLSVGLGWLFEMPVIPDTMFTKSSEKISSVYQPTNSCSVWDKIDLVDQHLLYTCCPYLGELRSILAEAVLGKANKRGYMKKIKPICADNVEASSSSCPLLQTQLEDNFFRNQPEFLKKDADFIITRIYLNMVHMVKTNIIHSELEQAKLTLVTENTFDIRNWREVNKEEFKDKHKVLIMKLCNKIVDGVLDKISSEVNKECKSRSFIAVQSLTPHDINEIIIKTASGIVHQSAMNKLMEWSHQNISVIIEKLVRKDMDKMITKEQNLAANTYRVHAEDTDHPFNWFYQQLLDKESAKNKTQAHAGQSVVGESQRNDSVQKIELDDVR